MRILMITPELPYPLDQGGRIRMFHFLEHLASQHEVHLISVVSSNIPKIYLEKFDELCASFQFVTHPVTPVKTVARIVRSVFERRPYILSKYFSKDLRDAVIRQVSQIEPDCILVESQYIVDSAIGLNVPVVVDLHDSAYILYSRFAKTTHWHPKKIHGYLQRAPMKKFESALPERVHRCVTTSQHDKSVLESLSGMGNISVIANGVDADFFQKAATVPASIEYELLFVGSMDYFPNIDGVDYLMMEIMPKVWASFPDTRVAIVGRNPVPTVRQFETDDRVFVSGFVDDVRPFYEKSKIVVVPIQMGSGTRLKVLEAAAMGKAIIGTQIGLEGLTFENGKDMVVVEDTTAFVSQLTRLLTNDTKRNELENKSRTWVERNYSWNVIVPKLEKILRQAAQQTNKTKCELE